MNVVIITGAGVDRSTGIDFPTANQLLPALNQFIENEGKEIDITLRSMLPNFRFSFQKYINDTIDGISRMRHEKTKQLCEKINDGITSLAEEDKEKKLGLLLIRLFTKIEQIQSESIIGEDIYELIVDVFGDQIKNEIQDESILQDAKLTFSDSFKTILRIVLRESLRNTNRGVVHKVLSSYFFDIETLLIDSFLGFYNDRDSDIKKYLYLSWIMWAFLVVKERAVLSKTNDNLPFYSHLPGDATYVTLNYTTFLSKHVENSIYFHGSFKEYIRMDTRDIITIDDFEHFEIKSFLENEVKPNLSFEQRKFILPNLVPPLKIKPVLSNKSIVIWNTALEEMKRAVRIIIIGYSFNYADEHFNDIIRNNKDKQIIIINPSVENIQERLGLVLQYNASQATRTSICGHNAYKLHNTVVVEAKASEVVLEDLINYQI